MVAPTGSFPIKKITGIAWERRKQARSVQLAIFANPLLKRRGLEALCDAVALRSVNRWTRIAPLPALRGDLTPFTRYFWFFFLVSSIS